MSDYIYIGKIAAAHGLKGELILKHLLGKKIDFKNSEAVFIETTKHVYLPFFVEKSIANNDAETIVKFESVDNKEAAVKLLKKNIWLTKNDFEKSVSKKAPVNLIGFTVKDEGNILGEVQAVIEQPHQVLLQTIVNNKEVLIPLHEQTLIKIDRKKKEIHVTLPEGLLEIYLSN